MLFLYLRFLFWISLYLQKRKFFVQKRSVSFPSNPQQIVLVVCYIFVPFIRRGIILCFSNIPGIGVDDVFVIVQSYEIVSKELPADCSMPYKLAATMKSAVSFKLCYVTYRQSQRGYCTPPIISLCGHEKYFTAGKYLICIIQEFFIQEHYQNCHKIYSQENMFCQSFLYNYLDCNISYILTFDRA